MYLFRTLICILILISSSISHAQKLPTLSLDFQGEKAIMKILSPAEWRRNLTNSYKTHEKAIETAIIYNSDQTSIYTSSRARSILVHNKGNFNKKPVEKFFAVDNQDDVESHFALMGECTAKWCPLTRSATNHLRTEFENDFVDRVIRRYEKTIPLRYVGFGSAVNLLSDLRILMMLKKAGYQFEKIQFIDPYPALVEFIKFQAQTHGRKDTRSFPMNAVELQNIFNNTPDFNLIMQSHTIAQFLAILSNYPGNEEIEYYPNVDAYIKDSSNKCKKSHIITTFDLLEPSENGDNKKALSDFNRLKEFKNESLIGSLYADFTSADPKSHFEARERKFQYTLIAASNECEGCKNLVTVEKRCGRCVHKVTSYCSVECLKLKYQHHKKKFHAKKETT